MNVTGDTNVGFSGTAGGDPAANWGTVVVAAGALWEIVMVVGEV